MEEGSGPTGLRRDPTGETLREFRTNSRPTRRSPSATFPDHHSGRRCSILSVTMDSDLYRDITDFAHDNPSWLQHLVELWTEVGLVLFGVLFVVCWWRAR